MKMRCTTAVALLCGLTCFQPLASAAPTGHGPVFKNCSAEKQSFVLSTIKDALDLSALSSHAIDVARHGRNLDAFPETSALRDPNTAQDLIARWFGEETRPTATNGEENMAYIQGTSCTHSLPYAQADSLKVSSTACTPSLPTTASSTVAIQTCATHLATITPYMPL